MRYSSRRKTSVQRQCQFENLYSSSSISCEGETTEDSSVSHQSGSTTVFSYNGVGMSNSSSNLCCVYRRQGASCMHAYTSCGLTQNHCRCAVMTTLGAKLSAEVPDKAAGPSHRHYSQARDYQMPKHMFDIDHTAQASATYLPPSLVKP